MLVAGSAGASRTVVDVVVDDGSVNASRTVSDVVVDDDTVSNASTFVVCLFLFQCSRNVFSGMPKSRNIFAPFSQHF